MTKDIQKLVQVAEQTGELKERNRILRGLVGANLPPGIWPLIENIICPN